MIGTIARSASRRRPDGRLLVADPYIEETNSVHSSIIWVFAHGIVKVNKYS